MSKTKDEAIAYWRGANVGDKLIGIEARNEGLIIEISEAQEPKKGGSVKGKFKIIEIGNWESADKLKDLEDKNFTAKSFIEEIKSRLNHPKITHLVNINGFKIYQQ